MARVSFTANLQRHVSCPAVDVPGTTVREVLEQVFEQNEGARGYILDEQGVLRHHMMVFIDGEPVRDRGGLSDKVADNADVYVMQALSGG